MRNKIFRILFLLVFILFTGSCKKNEVVTADTTMLNYRLDDSASAGIKICVYLDSGVFDICKANTLNMLNEM